ncbi:NAD(P)/FAD-dependent oxidoreductase [Streptomyces griseus]|uniref:NAD(P)/FAD-dependent oxidoreductase n=1 Tax=Streptomyces griseus TaxID=1911 RepID=UPI0038139470
MSAHTVTRSVTVLGGGLAGLTVARELRAGGYDGAVRIVDPEGVPYDRPPLSKAYLEGRVTVEKLHLVPETWYADYGVELIATRAVRLDPGTGSVRLADGRDMMTDAVVLTTGGTPRRLPVPGGELSGVHTLRTRADADRLRDVLRPGTRIAIVGAGLIGAEVASTAVGRGAEVTLIDTVDPPLAAAVGPEMARVLHAMHPVAGIRVVTGALTAITLRQGAHVLHVDGEEVLADVVLSAVGIRAGTELARGAGLATDNGVLVDAQQRTGNPSVYAAGDCARRVLPHGGPGPRTEHWEAALHQGQSVAAAVLGKPAPAPQVPWFWSERHGSRLECVGVMNAEGRTVVRERDGQPPVFFRLGPDSTLLGCAALDSPRLVRAARRIIQSRRPTAAETLADPTVDLRGLPR